MTTFQDLHACNDFGLGCVVSSRYAVSTGPPSLTFPNVFYSTLFFSYASSYLAIGSQPTQTFQTRFTANISGAYFQIGASHVHFPKPFLAAIFPPSHQGA